MIRALRRAPGRTEPEAIEPAAIASALAAADGVLWVDCLDEPRASAEALLRDTFGFHPLAIDDAVQESHVPKVDDWGSYLYLVLHAVAFSAEAEEPLAARELDVFLGPRFLVTLHDNPLECVERVRSSFLRDPRMGEQGSEHLLYHLVDELASDAMIAVDAIDTEVEAVEDLVLSTPGPKVLARVLTVKRALQHLRRVVAPQREVLNHMARDDYAVIPRASRIYFRDIYDHLVRLYDIIEGMRDVAAGTLDVYLSVINNRMNEIMKTLTLITTLFMPLGALTGFFGMNFFTSSQAFTGWTGQIAFAVMWVLLAGVPGLMFLWVRRRRWV